MLKRPLRYVNEGRGLGGSRAALAARITRPRLSNTGAYRYIEIHLACTVYPQPYGGVSPDRLRFLPHVTVSHRFFAQ